MRYACLIAIVHVSLSCASVVADEAAIDFDRHIRPLLSDNCFSCHGPDAAERKADLRLDRREDAVAAGALDQQDLKNSPLLQRILSDDPDQVMPPPASNKRLTDAQKQLLRRWMEQGATFTQHWSFKPPVRPDVPAGRHPVDYLVEQQLQREGLSFSPPADPRTLARRLSLDLIGLPPDPTDVSQLVNDPSSRQIEMAVDRLLASPHYGERMAIAWLDVVRFADTIGYHSDNPRNVSPYRDYVIQSFNSNKPFDQFTIEQIAGDLLPDATLEQKVASCFNRLLLTTEEGGAQAKDYEARYLGDRVRAIGTAWLGLTIGCCQCHDHKFDPLTMHDFYSMGAFFADIEEAIIGKREEGISVPTPAQSSQLQLLKANLAGLQAELAAPHPNLLDEQTAWEAEQVALEAAAAAWQPLVFQEFKSASGQTLTVTAEQSLLASGQRPDKEVYDLVWKTDGPATRLSALRLEALPHESLPSGGSGRAGNGNFVLTEVIVEVVRSNGTVEKAKLAAARASIEQSQAADKHPDKKWSASSVIDGDAKGAEWGWAILPESKKPQQLQVQLAETIELSAGDQLHIQMRCDHSNPGHVLGHFRWSSSNDARSFQVPIADAAFAERVAIARRPKTERTADQQAKIDAAFREASPALAQLRDAIVQAKNELEKFEAALPKCLISKSMSKPRIVRVLPRGNWLDESGPIVQPKLPGLLTSSLPSTDRPLTRLDLARWLVREDNPLTARVFVNRLWKQFFGVGLSKNLDDVGAQGEAPSNGPLLDYLATEFVRSGWDIKHMVRLLVTSRAYQQTSIAPAELLARDPENRLLARQSRFRLPAELVRDNALCIAGLLSDEIGGPSVKPYQPEGYWENLNFPPRAYKADPAPLQHRRGLYVWWQRSFVHPSMLAFDAPTREECAADRPQSNIPQQALVLLNDPTYLEAARALAVRMVEERTGGRGADAAQAAGVDRASQVVASVSRAFERATARPPKPGELAVLIQLYDTALKSFSADSAAAEQLITAGGHALPEAAERADLAATIQVARALLNLHEVITRN